MVVTHNSGHLPIAIAQHPEIQEFADPIQPLLFSRLQHVKKMLPGDDGSVQGIAASHRIDLHAALKLAFPINTPFLSW
jgi:hypothetical protein